MTNSKKCQMPRDCSVQTLGMNYDLCVVLLAGGQSRRMGRNKALIPLQGRPMISRLAAEAGRLTDQILISANDPVYESLGLPIVPDIYKGQGPLAGLHAAMIHSERPLLLALACDLPSVKESFLRLLVRVAEGYDAVIPVTSDGRPHPLCAVYRRSCLAALERNLAAGINKVTEAVKSLNVNWLPESPTNFLAEDICNLNTPEDLAFFLNPPESPI
jgi:molybdopterin-guanine dinucleotide biosynthesis protein A